MKKVELLEEIVRKQDELITATKIFIAFKGHNFIEVVGSERLGKALASLKSQLSEAGEEKPVAYEWHNYGTGHCYVDYIPHPLQEAGYIKRPLFYE